MKDRDQSTAAPRLFRSSMVACGNTSIQWSGSANLGTSDSGMPISRRISIWRRSPDATRSAAPRIGSPVQWNACGKRTLWPVIRLKRAKNSARRNGTANPRCWYPDMYGYGTFA